MYFSEQGNVDDDATLITIFLVSFNLQSCCLLQSAVCSLQSANVIYRESVWVIHMDYIAFNILHLSESKYSQIKPNLKRV